MIAPVLVPAKRSKKSQALAPQRVSRRLRACAASGFPGRRRRRAPGRGAGRPQGRERRAASSVPWSVTGDPCGRPGTSEPAAGSRGTGRPLDARPNTPAIRAPAMLRCDRCRYTDGGRRVARRSPGAGRRPSAAARRGAHPPLPRRRRERLRRVRAEAYRLGPPLDDARRRGTGGGGRDPGDLPAGLPRPSRFRGDAPPRAWLASIADNAIKNRYRSRGRFRRIFAGADPGARSAGSAAGPGGERPRRRSRAGS